MTQGYQTTRNSTENGRADEVTLPPLPLDHGGRLPLVFHPRYDLALDDLRERHPFELRKRGRIFSLLRERLALEADSIYSPDPASDALLKLVHRSEYLHTLSDPHTAATVMGLRELRNRSAASIERDFLEPLRFAVGGTVLATALARHHGWAINLSGGFHHAKADGAEGFCFLADVAIAIRALHQTDPTMRVMSVDLDAHQGNGVASILGGDPRVRLFDMYNAEIYPRDSSATARIDYAYPVASTIDDTTYLELLRSELPRALDDFPCDLIVFNAGSDIFAGDRLGRMRISERAVCLRDEFVFGEALKRHIPIVMVLSGGYSDRSPELISGAILHVLNRHALIQPEPTHEPPVLPLEHRLEF